MTYCRGLCCALLLVLAAVHIVSGQGTPRYVVLCYFANWAQYRPEGGKFFPENIDPNLCTHILYAFAGFSQNRLYPYEWNDVLDYAPGLYNRTLSLKKTNPALKVLLVIGGWNAGVQQFIASASTADSRQQFTANAISFLRQYGFDGLDVDWEYPGSSSQGGSSADKSLYTLFVKAIREGFDQEAASTRRPRLLLTAAVSVNKDTIDGGYEVDQISMYLDFINLMAYDFHGPWDKVTGYNSPLYAYNGDPYPIYNLDFAARYWVQKGVPPAKLIIGMPFYGRGWQLSDPNKNGLGAPTVSAAAPAPYTKEAGYHAYYELCSLIPSMTVVRRTDSQAPYAYQGNFWLGYDDQTSIATKVKYLLEGGFGGAMIWSIDLDDFSGNFCGGQRYPLLTLVANCLIRGQGVGYCERWGYDPALQASSPVGSSPVYTSSKTVTATALPITTAPSLTTTTPTPTTTTPRPATTLQPAVNVITPTPWWAWIFGPTVGPTTTTTLKPVTGVFRCPMVYYTYVVDPYDCNRYYLCLWTVVVSSSTCSPGSYFNQVSGRCESRIGIC